GVKLDLLDGRLGMTLAAFHLKKKNVLTADPSNPGYQQTAGEGHAQPAIEPLPDMSVPPLRLKDFEAGVAWYSTPMRGVAAR
ncbi:hypothetical protein, partial [Pseudomonas aeruginosa]